MDDREDFENAFVHFVDGLRVLSDDAPTQYKEMGSSSAAWEIQHDVADAGLGVLRLSALYLEWDKACRILDLVASLRRMPIDAFLQDAASVTSTNLLDHPYWQSLRDEAKQMLKILAPEIERNSSYFME